MNKTSFKMKKVSYYLLGLALLTICLIGLHIKGLMDAVKNEKKEIDQKVSSAVCHTFEQISTEKLYDIDVRDCNKLGNGSFQLIADSPMDQLSDAIHQKLSPEDKITFPYQVLLTRSGGENKLIQSKQESKDRFYNALVNVEVPPLRRIVFMGWGTELLIIILILSTMIWTYYQILITLNNNNSKINTSKAEIIQLGNYSFDVCNQALSIHKKQKRITALECQVLHYLSKRKNQITRRDEILMALWGENDYFKGRSLDVFISRLRKYLSEDDKLRIETVHGVGFILIET